MKNNNESFWETVIAVLAVILIFLYAMLVFPSCKLLSKVNKASTDSVQVVKGSEVLSKVDTSKNKTETASTKETIYYPQPIYIQGKDGETKVIFAPQSTKESGTTKTEDNTAKFEQMKKDFSDSLSVLKNSKKSETKAGTDWLQIAILSALGLLVFKHFIAPYISLIKK
jgi:hypothetical protein